jgi:hypothetical protein
MKKYFIYSTGILFASVITYKIFLKIKKIYKKHKDQIKKYEKVDVIDNKENDDDFTNCSGDENSLENSDDSDDEKIFQIDKENQSDNLLNSHDLNPDDTNNKILSKYYSVYGLGLGNENIIPMIDHLIIKKSKQFGIKNLIVCDINNLNYNLNFEYLLDTITKYPGIIGYVGSLKILEPMSLEKQIENYSNKYFENPRDKIYLSSSIKYITIGHLILCSNKYSNSINKETLKNIAQYYNQGIKLYDVINKDIPELIKMLDTLYKNLGLDKYPRNVPLYTIEQIDVFSNKIYIDIDYKTLFTFEYDIKNIIQFRTKWNNIVDPLYFKDSMLFKYSKTYLCIISNSTLLDQVNGLNQLTFGSGTPNSILDSLALNLSDHMIKKLKNYGVINSFTLGKNKELNLIKNNKFDEQYKFVGESNIKWLDIELLNLSIKISGPSQIVITGLDQLANYSKSIKIYIPSVKYDNFDSKYVEIDNWFGFNFSNVKNWKDLHINVKRYVEIVENLSKIKILGISIGNSILVKN